MGLPLSETLDPKDYPDLAPFLLGPEVPAPAREKGPKDTVLAKPFTVSIHPDLPPTTVWGYTWDKETGGRST